MREINNGGGWNIQPLVAHFGLGKRTKVETLPDRWPSGNGSRNFPSRRQKTFNCDGTARLLATSTSSVRSSLSGEGATATMISRLSTNLSEWALVDTRGL
jgi:hypothetical protein